LLFSENGTIDYGYCFEENKLINGFQWILKDDFTYDKFKVEYVKVEKEKKEETENQDADESGSEGS
jgi:hypothetical protein